ncbi:hypothetical protein M9979_10365 [Sphingomonas sp. RP10(2022)]|uniref:Uncharacterized protein n=1 Tax=Sphingomonas liriopis TaxID=2949094 RepID=A0A9X2HX95_9SPHN|nr:hypothetical protein [Sphingomonas liriopis]MCP3735273.1 hypothetical protein [Sphingomonas liriopis]
MMSLFVLAAQLAGASPLPMPPQDWTVLRPLPYARDADDGASLSAFVRSEVKAGHCAAATLAADGWTLKIDLAVLIGPAGQPRRIVPRAIACPSVEQYAAGLVSSLARSNIAPNATEPGSWYRTSLTFSWPQ